MLEQRSWVPLAHHEATRRLTHILIEVQAGARDGVQGAVWEAGQAGIRAEAAAGQAGLWAGQAGWDGRWHYIVPHCVVERQRAHGEACGTLFHTTVLIEVIAGIALCNTERNRCK